MTSPITPPDPEHENLGQVPITEEFDSYKHTMPNAVPVVAAMLLVAIVLGILAYAFRAKPVVTGTIDEAFAATLPNQNGSLAVITLSFRNTTDKPLRLLNVNVAVHAKGTDLQDDFGPVADFPRYFEALPVLQEHARPGLTRDARLAPKEAASGSVIVSFPLTQEEFDARDSLTVTMKFDGHPPVKLTSGKRG